jgi:replication factor C small subunit
MSENQAEREVWVEKYRPRSLDEVRGHESEIDAIQNYVDEGDIPNLLFSGPPGVGKTATAVAVAREIYGDEWESNFMELNASDDRGIDIVRNEIKDFARSSFSSYSFRIIFLDEADALTSDAQAALRRTMEKHTNNVRFILSCNYASQIIGPIQSRCARYRFSPLKSEPMKEQIKEISENENIEITDEAVDALVFSANGDMRNIVNGLQAVSITNSDVDVEDVYAVTNAVRPEDIDNLVKLCDDGKYLEAQDELQKLLTEKGVSSTEVIDNLHRNIWDMDVTDREAVNIAEALGQAEYRISQGADERVQMDALLATLTGELNT